MSFVFCLALVFCLAFIGCKSTSPAKPLDQLTADEAHGHAVFQAHCAVCHNDRIEGPVNAPVSGPSLLGVTRKPYLPSGAPASDERITATVLHGRNMMPAQPSLDDQEVADLLKYLHTL